MSLLTLLAHPEQLARLPAEPALIPDAVEEFMRYVPLGTGLPPARITTCDTTLGGVTIPRGKRYGRFSASPTATPPCFPIQITSTSPAPATHMGFGFGAHHCLGAQLARIELQEAFRGLLSRLPGLRLAVPASELRYKENMTINSLMSSRSPGTPDSNRAFATCCAQGPGENTRTFTDRGDLDETLAGWVSLTPPPGTPACRSSTPPPRR